MVSGSPCGRASSAAPDRGGRACCASLHPNLSGVNVLHHAGDIDSTAPQKQRARPSGNCVGSPRCAPPKARCRRYSSNSAFVAGIPGATLFEQFWIATRPARQKFNPTDHSGCLAARRDLGLNAPAFRIYQKFRPSTFGAVRRRRHG
jgi:hypothetical protein